jgi:putative hemolysin
MATNTALKLFRGLKQARQQKSLLQRVREYQGHIKISYETDDFLVTTAQTSGELTRALELRHQVFVQEWQGRSNKSGLDVDQYDFVADHLMIVDKRIQQIVGTYRLISSHFSQDFYSSSEFELEGFLRLPAVKLEMGRACVHPDYRDGNTIDLLWKGLTRYIFTTKTEYLFGCASLHSMDPVAIGKMYKTLREQESWSDDYRVRTDWRYQFPGFAMNGPDALTVDEKRALMPPLLRSYLHAGAKVHGWPALDRDFACTDLLTILDWKRLNPRFQSRFMVKD